MIGSGQLVWGQGNIPVEVPINGYPGNNTLTKTIYTEHLNRGVFISELAYSADPTYPYGKLIELTTTTEFPSFDLSNYTIRLVCRCDGMSPNWLDYPASSLILLGGTAIMGQQQAQILSLENITYPSYTCTNPNLYIILYKNPVPTNLINNPLDFIGINENYIYPYYGVNVAHGIGLSVGQTYQRHDSGWIAENSTLGTVNTNLTTCDMYIMMYNTGLYSLIPTPNENYLSILMSPQCLPSQKNPLWYYHVCNNDWASSTSLYPWTTDNSYHDKNVRTVFFSGIKALDYFKNRHHFEAWGNTSSSYGLNNVFRRLSYQQEGNWQISNNEVRIIKQGATCVTTGHEMGHKVNNGSAPNSGAAPVTLPAWWDEGFADIWGTCVEKYAFGLTKPRYRQSAFNTNGTWINYRNVDITDLGSSNIIYNSLGFPSLPYHDKGMLVSRWFSILSEGVNRTVPNVTMFGGFQQDIYQHVCGISDEAAARIAYQTLTRIISNTSDDPIRIRDWSLLAVDDLYSSQEGGIFNDPNFVKAQVKNAWAAVNVGQGDFYVLGGDNIEACEGQPLTLSANIAGNTESINTITWTAPNGTVSTGSTLFIPNATAANAGTYIVTASYNSPYLSQPCSQTQEVHVSVNGISIQANALQICAGSTLILSAITHPNIDNSSITWTKPNGTQITTPTLTLSATAADAGTYTVTANCTAPNGSIVQVSDNIVINVIVAPVTVAIGTIQDEIFVEGNTSICAGNGVTLNASGGNVTWLEGGIQSASMLVSPTTTTTYHAQICNPVCPNLCTTATITVTVNPLPNPTITPTLNNCSVTLTAAGGSTYAWTTGANAASIEVATPNTYTVTVTNTNGCTATAQYAVTAAQIATLDFSGNYMVGTTTPALGTRVGDVETWDNPNGLRIAGTVTVPNGKRLIIKSGITVEMVGTQSGFTVAKNAVLRVKEGSTLRGDACQNNYWKGITVNGNYQVAHPANYLTNGSTEHGIVTIEGNSIEGNSTLQDATIGIDSRDAVTTDGFTLITGGGIVYAEDANFTNNLTDINIGMQAAFGSHVLNTQRSVIRRCTFLKNAPFLSGTTQKYVAIRLNSSSATPTMVIHQNLFTTENLTADNRGTGIRITNDKVNIESTNVFQNLFKGIDAYNLLTTIKGIKVIGNTFVNVAKGVTLNNVVGGKVENNSFTIPTGNSGTDNDTYGLTLYEAKAVNVKDNTFYATTSAPYTRGFVAYKCSYTGYQTNVTNNLFEGNFSEATLFSDNNRFLQMQCNAYNGCQKDWYFDAQAKLDPQGICDPEQSEKALRNHFHYLPPGIIEGDPNYTHHLFIANGNTYFTPTNKLTLRTDNSPQSLPTAINNVAVTDADFCFPGIGTFKNTSCTVDFPTDPWSGGCAWAGNGGNNANLQATIYRLLQTEETDSLLALLNCLNTDWAIRMLVGTYTDNRNFTQALALLALLPNTPENTEFATIYTAIINELQGNTTGRTIPTKTILEKMAATQRRSQPNVLAETALASYFGYDYTRSFETEKTASLPTNATAKSFSIIPNPAQDVVTIVFATEVASNTTFTIYDINGKATTSVAVSKATQQLNLNISQLASGIYYCRLANSAGIEKLVIIGK
jgi:hypothetical protein